MKDGKDLELKGTWNPRTIPSRRCSRTNPQMTTPVLPNPTVCKHLAQPRMLGDRHLRRRLHLADYDILGGSGDSPGAYNNSQSDFGALEVGHYTGAPIVGTPYKGLEIENKVSRYVLTTTHMITAGSLTTGMLAFAHGFRDLRLRSPSCEKAIYMLRSLAEDVARKVGQSASHASNPGKAPTSLETLTNMARHTVPNLALNFRLTPSI